MITAFKNFKKYRFLLYELVKKDIKLKYRRSYLGIVWTLLEPLLTMMVLTMVFGVILNKGGKTYPVYILTARLLYTFFANSTKAAMKAIRSNSGMIKKVYVPKYIYPVAAVLSNFVIFVISLVVLVGVSIVLKVQPTVYIIQAIVPLILVLVFALGTGIILSTMAVFFRDLEYLWSVILMMVMYTSAIFYYPDEILLGSTGWIIRYNPLYAIIVNFRNSVLYGKPLEASALIYSTAVSVGLLFFGIFLFYKKQDKFILNI